MATIDLDIPSDVLETIERRASAAGQTVEEYLLAWLIREAEPSLEERLSG